MRPSWLWDKDISVEEIQKILKDPKNKRFVNIAALLLSRNNVPKEVFTDFLSRERLVQHWARIKRQMRKDAWNDPRIDFWQAVYEKLVEDLKARGIAIRKTPQDKRGDELYQEVGAQIKRLREERGWTQNELASKLKVSQQVISRLESGRENLSLSTLKRIFGALGAQVSVSPRLRAVNNNKIKTSAK